MVKKKYKVIDLFAGIGGLSYGFYHNDYFELVAANELLADMCKTYRLNHPGVNVYKMDIANFGIDILKQNQGINKGNIDIIIGGPPCQAYSTVGKRLMDDPRGKLFQEYYRILKELEPKMFIYENVKGLLSMGRGGLIKYIVKLFSSLGYKVQYKLINVANYGVPQLRERVIMVGIKGEGEFSYPQETHNELGIDGLKKWITLDEAVGELPVIMSGETKTKYELDPYTDYQREMRKGANMLYDHSAPNNGIHLLELMKYLPEGGTPMDVPKELRPKSGFGNTYSRLWSDRPGMTITRNLGTPSSSRCIHPKQDRPLSTREGARIQSFPDIFRFVGSTSSKNLQIGNAVPPILSKHLAKSALDYLDNNH